MSQNNNCQQKYWDELFGTRYVIYYLNLYQQKYENIDRRIKCFLALASSSSIASWAIWNKLFIVWSIIIATSQIISAIQHLFPFEKKLKNIYELSLEYARISLFAENEWFFIAKGDKNEEEINKAYFDLKKLKLEAEEKYFGYKTLPLNYQLGDKAEDFAKSYFRSYN